MHNTHYYYGGSYYFFSYPFMTHTLDISSEREITAVEIANPTTTPIPMTLVQLINGPVSFELQDGVQT